MPLTDPVATEHRMSVPPTHPCEHPCEHRDGNDLTENEKQLQERHHLACVKRNYILSPLIHQFPLEIVSFIFILAFPPREACPWCTIVPSEQGSPLVLTKVCHTWRALALSTPRLWSYLSVDVEKPNFPLLNHQIAHSGLVPLSVYLFPSGYGTKQGLASAKQAMSLVIKQLHRIASLYLLFTDDIATEWGSIDYPKTAPLLKELHFHCLDDGPSSSFQLRLAIEPPCPRQVCLSCISFDQIRLDWTRVSSLTLVLSDIRMLPPALKSLKHLVLMYTNWDRPAGQTPVVSQSIQHVTQEDSDLTGFMLAMTLPSLRTLDVDITDIRTLSPIACDFLHRSLCPLQVLSIHYDGNTFDDDERVIQALIEVLETTKVLQRLTLQLSAKSFPSSNFEPLVRRFLSQDRGFLPCLQTLSLETQFIPPIDLLLDAMAPNAPTPEILSGPNKERPLRSLYLGLCIPLDEIGQIRQDVLVRILEMRAAGNNISITCMQIPHRSLDLVEHWKSSYGFGED